MSLESVVKAAKLAAIHDEIIQMPMGYETLVGEGGARLSGGQLQRIALARALAHNPRILILDEATSHLDALTERLVDHNLSQISCTHIVISHRLSTVRNHAELLALQGCYAELVHSQLEDDTDDLPGCPALTISSNGRRSSQAGWELMRIADKGGRNEINRLDTPVSVKEIECQL
jgi:ABC-type transport system involved in cytochrome bd biosynthesis fused ATPase/permease subunit